MQTIEIKIYCFDELSEEAQEYAINKWRNDGINTDYIYQEAHETVKKGSELLGFKEGRNSFLEFSVSHLDDNILELKGLRLRKYLINNFELYKGKYYSVKANRPINHKRVKNTTFKNGNTHVAYYSAIQKDNCCVLTGMCYDDDFLSPIYEFINNYRSFPSANYQTFSDILEYCFSSLKKSIESEEEYRNSDEAIKEDIKANEYAFLESGKIYK